MKPPKHRNSLGYVIGAGRRDQAMIVFGHTSDRRLISIDDAQRGMADGLRCECGIPLVAKKDDVREHHFAHKAGSERSCAVATRAQLIRFISNTLLDHGEIELPVTGGRSGRAKILALEEVATEDVPTLRIDAQRDRKLIAAFKLQRRKLDSERLLQTGISTIEVDLSQVRNKTDAEIVSAIVSNSPRRWLFRAGGEPLSMRDNKSLFEALFPELRRRF